MSNNIITISKIDDKFCVKVEGTGIDLLAGLTALIQSLSKELPHSLILASIMAGIKASNEAEK